MADRIKYRQDITGQLVSRTQTKGNTATAGPNSDTSTTYGGIQLEGESILYGSGPFGIPKPCQHVSAKVVLHDITQDAAIAANHSYGYPLSIYGVGSCGQLKTNVSAFAVPGWCTRIYPYTNGSVELNLLHLLDGYDPEPAIQQCISDIGLPKVDLPLFLLEATELKTLAKQWNPKRVATIAQSLRRSIVNSNTGNVGIGDIVAGMRRAMRGLNTKSARRTALVTSDYYLSYMFGVKPLIRDLRNTVKLLSSLQERAAQFRNAGTRIKSQSVRVIHNVTLPPTIESRPGTSGYAAIRKSCQKLMEVGTVTVRYLETQPALNGFEAALEQFTRDFGIRLNARTLWDHIPFSFIIDWFAGVGDYISNVENRFRNGSSFVILGSTYSLKMEYQRFLETQIDGSQFPGNPYYGPRPFLLQASESVKLYDRRVASVPTVANAYAASGLDSSRFSLGTALAIQRARRRGRSRGVVAKTARGLQQIDRKLANFDQLYQ